jgi:hypothetical protein
VHYAKKQDESAGESNCEFSLLKKRMKKVRAADD